MVSVKHLLCVWYTEDAPKTVAIIVIIITIIIIICLIYALHVIYQKKVW